jgi:hypothetical protein
MVRFIVQNDYNKLQINQNTKLVRLPFLREGRDGFCLILRSLVRGCLLFRIFFLNILFQMVFPEKTCISFIVIIIVNNRQAMPVN